MDQPGDCVGIQKARPVQLPAKGRDLTLLLSSLQGAQANFHRLAFAACPGGTHRLSHQGVVDDDGQVRVGGLRESPMARASGPNHFKQRPRQSNKRHPPQSWAENHRCCSLRQARVHKPRMEAKGGKAARSKMRKTWLQNLLRTADVDGASL